MVDGGPDSTLKKFQKVVPPRTCFKQFKSYFVFWIIEIASKVHLKSTATKLFPL